MKIKHLRLKIFVISTTVALFVLTSAFIINNYKGGDTASKNVTYYESENEYLNSLRVNPNTGTVSPIDYAKASKEVQAYKKLHSQKSGWNWEFAGPENLAGRVRSMIKIELGSKTYWYAGSVAGGLWRIEEGTTVWYQVTGNTSNLNISCLYQAADGAIYVGTGESFYSENFNLLPGFKGRGIYKSTDGVNFSVFPSTVPSENASYGEEWFYVNKIAATNNTLFAGTNTGLKVSGLQGNSWSLAKTNDGAQLVGECTDVVTNGTAVVAFVDGLAYISENGNAENFKCVSTKVFSSGTFQNPTMLPHDSIGRISFAFSPTNPNYLYAVAINKYDIAATEFNDVGALQNIYLSVKGSNGWSDWKTIGPGGSNYMFYVFKSNGLYSTALLVDPVNPNRIYIGGSDMWRGDFIEGFDFYQWTQLTTYENAYSIAYAPSNHFAYINGDNNNIIIACENGVYTFNKNNGRCQSFNTNLRTSQFYTVSADCRNTIYGGSQGNGTVMIRQLASGSKYGYNLHPSIGSANGYNFFPFNIGGYVHNSMIYGNGTIVSINGKDDIKDDKQNGFAGYTGVQSLAMYRFDDQVPQNLSSWSGPTKYMEDSASYITPSLLYENFNYTLSQDSVWFTADKNYSAGDTITAKSKNASYPFESVLSKPLTKGSKIKVQDVVASRFFVGVKGSIFMTKEASNFLRDFTNNEAWYTISSSKLNGVTGTPQSMALSKEANYLYVGTKEGKLYRISNIAYACDSATANVGTNLYATSAAVLNPYCVINTTLIASFPNRVITSIAVHPEDAETVIVTLGNYGFNDYIFYSENALSQNPTFTPVQSFAKTPIYTAIFVEGIESNKWTVMIGSDFGAWTTENIKNPTWIQETSIEEIPVFMLKQQNVQTINEKPVYYGEETTYIQNFRAIYAATFGGGIYQCKDLVKTGNGNMGINTNNVSDSKIAIYPNPAKDYTTINVTVETNNDVTLYVYNISGNLVKVLHDRSNSHQVMFKLNTTALPTGTYIVKAVVPNGKPMTSKFIVVK